MSKNELIRKEVTDNSVNRTDDIKKVDGAITDGDRQYMQEILEQNKLLANQIAELQKTNLELMNRIKVDTPTVRSSIEILNEMFD